jgi:hypothetical protein
VIVFASSAVMAMSAPIARATESTHAPDVYAFGDASFYGSTGSVPLTKPIVGMASTPSGHGYWSVASDGGIFSFGDAHFFGSTGAMHLNQPIVGMTSSPSGHGYWLVASDGGMFSFGDAHFFGSTGAMHLNKPVVGMQASPSGRGYWLVASDGGIFSFGDARFFGSTGGLILNKPIVGMSASPSGRGYRFVATDGGIFSFGDATYHGSLGGAGIAQTVVGMDATPSGNGYWLAEADGGVFGFGDASLAHAEAAVALPPSQHAIDIVAAPVGQGYWVASSTAVPPNPKVEAAIAWYMSRVGQDTYTGQCELAAENAFGTESRYPTAMADWLAQPVKHTDWQNAPRGALVFWNTGSSGHVAISVGDGLVVSTSVGSRVGVVATGYFQNPLGWTDSPFL